MDSQSILIVLLVLLGIVAFGFLALVAFFLRNMVRPPQQQLWMTPADRDIDYEDVKFPSTDGVPLAGWFIPAPENSAREGATIIMIQGWLANRLGGQGKTTLARWSGIRPLLVFPLAEALHRDGFNLLMFDLRNHGESGQSSPVTFGVNESQDLLGALEYLSNRSEVDEDRICVIGVSMGANTLVFTLPQTDKICAGIAAQPTTMSVFNERFARKILGPVAPVMNFFVERGYRLAGGPPRASVRPAEAAARAGDTPMLYIQGTGDPFGTVEDVQNIAAATPGSKEALIVEAKDRIDGYYYAIDHPNVLIDFFDEHLPARVAVSS